MITVQQLGRTLLKSAGKKFIKEIIGKKTLKTYFHDQRCQDFTIKNCGAIFEL